jgi:hypothetical protein
VVKYSLLRVTESNGGDRRNFTPSNGSGWVLRLTGTEICEPSNRSVSKLSTGVRRSLAASAWGLYQGCDRLASGYRLLPP